MPCYLPPNIVHDLWFPCFLVNMYALSAIHALCNRITYILPMSIQKHKNHKINL